MQKCANILELEKCCRTHILLQNLKFRFDTAENEPAKSLQNWLIFPILLINLSSRAWSRRGRGRLGRSWDRRAVWRPGNSAARFRAGTCGTPRCFDGFPQSELNHSVIQSFLRRTIVVTVSTQGSYLLEFSINFYFGCDRFNIQTKSTIEMLNPSADGHWFIKS